MSSYSIRRRAFALVGVAIIGSLALAGCAKTSTSQGGGGNITIGTTDKITSLDPAGAYDNGSFAVAINVFPMLMGLPYKDKNIGPDIAAEAGKFIEPQIYQVKLKPGLTFVNGNKLTAEDVKFSFDRLVKINNENGPQSLLANLEKTEVKDELTVDFYLKSPNDQTFPQVLTTPAGLIVDHKVFSPTELTPADKIVKDKAFAGPYEITDYKENSLISYKKFAGYKGMYPAENAGINAKYFADETSLAQAVQAGDIDVAYRSLSPTAVKDLETKYADKVTVHKGPGGELRYLVFNTDIMPFGAKTTTPDPAKALAVRQAIANVIDRKAIAKDVYKDTYAPAYSMVPEAMAGSVPALKGHYGTSDGAPDTAKAEKTLKDAGVAIPLDLKIQYNPDHYGKSSADEYGALKSQLDASGLFKVELQSTAWTTYNKERIKSYPIYQLGWFPDFSDPDNYLTPFFTKDNFVGSYNDAIPAKVQELIAAQATQPDQAKRSQELADTQEELAKALLTLPMLTGQQVAVSQKNVKGITLDVSFKFHYSPLTK